MDQYQYQYQTLAPLLNTLVMPFPFVDDCDLFINNSSGGSGPPGPIGPPGPPGIPGLVPVTIVANTPFAASTANYFLGVDVATAASVVLPVSPTGTVFIVKDIDGDATTNPITITATGGTLIDGAASALINSPYGSLSFVFNGTQWNLV